MILVVIFVVDIFFAFIAGSLCAIVVDSLFDLFIAIIAGLLFDYSLEIRET